MMATVKIAQQILQRYDFISTPSSKRLKKISSGSVENKRPELADSDSAGSGSASPSKKGHEARSPEEQLDDRSYLLPEY